MSKKKNKTESASLAPAAEAAAVEAAGEPSVNGMSDAPAEPDPQTPPPAAELPRESAPLEASPAPAVPDEVVSPAPELSAPVLESPPAEAAPATLDLVPISPPQAEVAAAPLATPAPEVNVAPLLERIQKLEEALAHVQSLHGIEERVVQRVATQLQREKPEPAPSSFRDSASALLDAGKSLLPVLTRPAAVPVAAPANNAPVSAHRAWLLWDIIAEARAIIRMYVDPRYRLSWLGRTVPLVLGAAFFTTQFWVPFSSLPFLGWLPARMAELVIGFVLFKVLGYEARRYRETAPDLPSTLRL